MANEIKRAVSCFLKKEKNEDWFAHRKKHSGDWGNDSIVQIAIIGYVSWMQPTTGVTALLILILTWLLSKNRSGLQ